MIGDRISFEKRNGLTTVQCRDMGTWSECEPCSQTIQDLEARINELEHKIPNGARTCRNGCPHVQELEAQISRQADTLRSRETHEEKLHTRIAAEMSISKAAKEQVDLAKLRLEEALLMALDCWRTARDYADKLERMKEKGQEVSS